MVEGARLEIVCTSKGYLGFKSLTLRHKKEPKATRKVLAFGSFIKLLFLIGDTVMDLYTIFHFHYKDNIVGNQLAICDYV